MANFERLYSCFNAIGEDKLKKPLLQVIGGGKMATALVEGFVNSKCFEKQNITICTKTAKSTELWRLNGYSSYTIEEFYKNFVPQGIVLIAVKPQMFTIFCEQFKSFYQKSSTDNFIFVSVLAGLSTKYQWDMLANISSGLIRLMPNVCCEIGQGTILVTSLAETPIEYINLIVELGSQVGLCEYVNESVFNAASAISGCGPAFVFTMLDALIDGGVLSGLSRELAQRLAVNMVAGSALLCKAADEQNSPAKLKAKVCSPAGTTIAGIRTLEKAGVRSAFMEAVYASTKRADELAELFNKQ